MVFPKVLKTFYFNGFPESFLRSFQILIFKTVILFEGWKLKPWEPLKREICSINKPVKEIAWQPGYED
jgi:hypothetical protein